MNPGMTWEVILRQISATDRDDRIKSLKRFIGTAFAFSALEKEAQVHLLAHEFGQSAIVFGIINEIDRIKRHHLKWLETGIKDYENDMAFIAIDNLPPCFPVQCSYLYVRDCYSVLLGLCEGQKLVGITGNPGTGKTFFGIYLVFFLIKTMKTLVYDRGNPYFISENSMQPVTLELPEVDCYILDAHVKDHQASSLVKAKQYIYIYSPASKNKHWELNKGLVLHMPIWKRNEIKKFYDFLHVEDKEFTMTDSELDERFQIFGGIPRYIFATASGVEEELRRLKGCLDNPDFLSLSSFNDIAIPHLIFHRHTATMTSFIISIATNYVEELIAVRLESINKLNISKFLASAINISPLSVLRGQIYEQFSHKQIANGGRFQCYKYGDLRNIQWRTIEEKQYVKFSLISEVDDDEAVYGVPHSLNFHYIDAISDNDVYQMTIMERRSLPDKFQDLVHQLRKEIINFYYVVPEEVFSKFTLNSWDTKWKNVSWINFFVLEVPIS